MMIKHVSIFCGGQAFKGVSPPSVKAIDQMIRSLFPKEKVAISHLSNNELATSNWNHERVLVLPGGVCSQWDELIPQKVQYELVLKKVRIFAVCAGSYFCAERSEFQVSIDEKIVKCRSLALFPGLCRGPAYSSKPRIVKVKWMRTGEEGHVAVIGGPVFIPNKDAKKDTFEVLARYTDEPEKDSIAVVKSFGGIFSGPHWEFGEEELKSLHANPVQKMYASLQKSEQFRIACFQEMMADLLGWRREKETSKL